MQRGIVVGVNTTNNNETFINEMNELKDLCFACNILVVDTVVQSLTEFNNKSYIGKGKIEEVITCINSLDLDLVVFNDELSPSQISYLEDRLEILVFDRTYIILEIFKRRARTKEAILQVEIASLRYLKPRLTALRSGFSRQRSGGGMAHGKGKGETQLDLDRRNIGEKIAFYKNELNELSKNRLTQRKKRISSNIKTVCLVGYTNSGKSSTLNAILSYSTKEKKTVVEKDMLFQTLETSTRRIKLENNREFLLTDTVGFISKLPHSLIEAFKSTLEEIMESSLIIHVVDASNNDAIKQLEVTNNVLQELGCENIPTIYAFNKIDKVEDYYFIPPEYENAIRVSAKENINIKNLIDYIQKELFIDECLTVLEIPYSDSSIYSFLKENVVIEETKFEENIIIKAWLNDKYQLMYKKYIKN